MLILSALLLAAALQPADAAPSDPADVTEIDAIECRLDVPDYTGFAMALEGEEHLAQTRRWKKIASKNAFMAEYELPQPITVAGGHSTRRIGFTGDSIIAILDLRDPAVVARAEHIANAMDSEPLIAALVATGKVTRAQAEADMPFRKFLGERILTDVTEPATDPKGFGTHFVVVRTISNASTHQGKTFYGCAYRIEMLDAAGTPL